MANFAVRQLQIQVGPNANPTPKVAQVRAARVEARGCAILGQGNSLPVCRAWRAPSITNISFGSIMPEIKRSPIPDKNKIVTVAQMQAIEQAADQAGHSFADMMELAGRRVAGAVIDEFGARRPVILILVGPGHNGGDGLVCAHYLHRAGLDVRVFIWKRQTSSGGPDGTGDALIDRLQAAGVAMAHANDDPTFTALKNWLYSGEVVVDALLGTGANRPIQGELAEILQLVHAQLNDRQPPAVVAVDCPSGLNSDTGAVDPLTAPANLTVTFAYAKQGHYLFPGAAICGRLVVADIGTPPELAESVTTFLLDARMVAAWLPQRSHDSHKGSFGKVMLAVGSIAFSGAAYLACAAAGRAGAGLVTGAVVQAIWPVVAAKLAEATWVPLPTDSPSPGDSPAAIGSVNGAGADLVAQSLPDYDALVLGCGLTQTTAARAFVAQLLAHTELPPTVIDADGLNNLAQLDDWPARLPATTILTPHPAEMARLTGLSMQEVVTRRWELARANAAAWRAVLLIKGPYTVIAAPDGRLAVLPVATSALATAGTGDVLAGAIGGLLAQGMPAFEAACVGAWLHGAAGQQLAAEIGAAGTLASDLLPRLPVVRQQLADRMFDR